MVTVLNTAAIINFRRHKCNYRMEDRQIPQADWINTSSLRIKTKDMFGPVIKAMHHDMTVVTLTGEA